MASNTCWWPRATACTASRLISLKEGSTFMFARVLLSAMLAWCAAAQPPTHADILRGEYGRYRANNDLLFYHLDVRVDPERKYLSGKNTIRFRMLQDDTRIQLDLSAVLTIDKILLGTTKLAYQRDARAVFIDFPDTLKAGRDYSIDF